MSIVGLILAEGDNAPFSAVVTPSVIFRSENTGVNVTGAFTATPAGTGPYTYLWATGSDITPNSPAASSCSYTVNTVLAPIGPNSLTCTVTDTSTGQIFAAPFQIVLVEQSGRLDEN